MSGFDVESDPAETTGLGMLLAYILAASVLFIATVILIAGWGLGVDFLVRVEPGWPAIVPTTVALFLLCAMAVLLSLHLAEWRAAGLVSVLLCLIAMGNLDSGFFAGAIGEGDAMSPASRAGFVLTGIAILAMQSDTRIGSAVHQWAATLVLLAANICALGFVYHLRHFGGAWFFGNLSLPSVLLFTLIELAVLFAARRAIWVHLLLDTGPGSQLLRMLLPVALLSPVLIGYLVLAISGADRGVGAFEFALVVAAPSWIVAGGLFLVAKWLNASYRRERAATRLVYQRDLALARAEALAVRAQKVASLGRIASGVAHDFNNLLTVIQGNLDLLSESDAQDVRQQCLAQAVEATRRGASLTEKLLSYGGKLVLYPETLILDRKVERLEAVLRGVIPEGARLHILLESGGLRIKADRAQLEEAIKGLVMNAVEAIEGSGVIEVSTGRKVLGDGWTTDVHGGAAARGEYLFVCVRDSGPGIAPDVMERITDPFFTTKGAANSSGLGLSMVEGFCQQSGGFLSIQSPPGEGARVAMYFPRVTDPAIANDPRYREARTVAAWRPEFPGAASPDMQPALRTMAPQAGPKSAGSGGRG